MGITRREFVKRAAVATSLPALSKEGSGASLASAYSAISKNEGVARPNILLILCDQMRWDAICGRSQCRMPNANRLAAQGIRFERSYTPVSLCTPGRTALLTGAFPWHNHMYMEIISPTALVLDMYRGSNPQTDSPGNEVLYSSRLHDVGYIQGYAGKWHSSSVRGPLDFGFEEFVKPLSLVHPSRLKALRSHLHVIRWMQWPGSKPFPMWGYLSDTGEEDWFASHWTADNAIRMMKQYAASGKPWHVEVQFETPHDPYVPLKKYLDRYSPDEIPVAPSFYDTFQGKPDIHRHESEIWGKVTEEDFRQCRACYFAFCEGVDAQIGRVLKALEETGQAENTMVILTADHGDMLGAHRMWIKDWMPYEDSHRVPLVIRWPARIRPGLVSPRLVQLNDLAHTIVEAAGAKPLVYAEGRSLLPLMEDPERGDWPDQILSAWYGAEYLFTQRMAITERYKYVFNGIEFDECYDLQNDPFEMRNVLNEPSYATVVDDMRARLWDLMNQFGDPYGDVGPHLPNQGRPNRYTGSRYLPRGKRSPSKHEPFSIRVPLAE